MAITEADWIAHAKRKQEEEAKEEHMAIGLLQQAAVDARFLTGRDEWDKYLRMLQAERDAAQKEIAQLQSRLVTPLSEGDLRLAYISLNVITERLRILTWCMTLPKTICDEAAKVTA